MTQVFVVCTRDALFARACDCQSKVSYREYLVRIKILIRMESALNCDDRQVDSLTVAFRQIATVFCVYRNCDLQN